jgi:hypothetical protein
MPIGSSRHRSALSVTGAVAAIVATCALFATIGADARWLATLGHVIVSRGRVPVGIPFASAPSGHWTNALVLAELAFNALVQAFGDRGLMLAQLIAVAVAMGVLAKDALDGGGAPSATTRALLIAALGALPSLVIVRSQLFSLALFPILCALLRADARRPSRRIWLVVPLLALWANLHGAVLLGLAVVIADAGRWSPRGWWSRRPSRCSPLRPCWTRSTITTGCSRTSRHNVARGCGARFRSASRSI